MTASRIIRLVERRSRLCHLRRGDLDYLLAYHRAHLDVQPGHRRGVYRLTPRGYVGMIGAPECRLEIKPKIPLLNVLHLLDPDDSLTLASGLIQHNSAAGLLELLAGRFANLLAERVAA